MLNGVESVLRLKQGSDSAETIFGAVPKDLPWNIVKDLQQDKTGMRKWQDGMIIVLPIVKSKQGEIVVWQVWILNSVPEISALPERVEEIRKAGAGFEQAELSRPSKASENLVQSPAIKSVLQRIASVKHSKKSALLKVFADEIVQAGLADQAVVAFSKSSQLSKISRKNLAVSNDALEAIKDELGRFLNSFRSEEPVSRAIEFSETHDENWESGIIMEMVEGKEVIVDTVSTNEAGLCFILIDPSQDGADKYQDELISLRNYYKSARPYLHSHKATLWQKFRWPLVGAIALGFLIFSLLPAPFKVSATVLTEPKEAAVYALETPAILDSVSVSPGDVVQTGDLIARLRSADLESQLADAKLQFSIEELEGKAALAENKYGSFVISEQRKEVENARIKMLEKRIEALTVRATEDGQIISSIPAGRAGSFIDQGMEIAKLQPSDGFTAALDFNKIDAPLVQEGQTGTAFFRGVSTKEFALQILHPVAVTPTEDGLSFRLIARADIVDGQNSDLIVGLSGFAKVEVGTRPRVLSWSRFVREFVREKLWIYLNLKI